MAASLMSNESQKLRNRFYIACAFICSVTLFAESDFVLKLGGSEFHIPSKHVDVVVIILFFAVLIPLLVSVIGSLANFSVDYYRQNTNERLVNAIQSEEKLVLSAAVRCLNDTVTLLNDKIVTDEFPMPFRNGERIYTGVGIHEYERDIKNYANTLTSYLDANPDHSEAGYRQERRKWLLSLLRKHFINLSDRQMEYIVKMQILQIEDEYRVNYNAIGGQIEKSKRLLRRQTILFSVIVIIADYALPLFVGVSTMFVWSGCLTFAE